MIDMPLSGSLKYPLIRHSLPFQDVLYKKDMNYKNDRLTLAKQKPDIIKIVTFALIVLFI